METHVAHVLLTQRPTDLSSILLSVEFEQGDLPDVMVRIAAAVERTVSRDHLASLVPALQWAPQNCLRFSVPQAIQQDEFQTWPGLCIRIRVDCLQMQASEPMHECTSDDSSLFQVSTTLQSPFPQLDGVALPKLQSFDSTAPSCSFTDEFIEAINAANQAAAFEVHWSTPAPSKLSLKASRICGIDSLLPMQPLPRLALAHVELKAGFLTLILSRDAITRVLFF